MAPHGCSGLARASPWSAERVAAVCPGLSSRHEPATAPLREEAAAAIRPARAWLHRGLGAREIKGGPGMPSFDAIIIGTGQAGPSLARRLADAGRRVAIIE